MDKKKFRKYLFVLFSVFIFTGNIKATTYIDIENNKLSTDSENYQDITLYDSLEEFLKDYQNDNLPSVYLTNFLFDGVSSVKSPDLDDFIESNSNDTKIKTLKITALNIKDKGDYELTGTAKSYMVAINTNGVKGNINLILNNVNIDTDSKKTPAIFVYNKDINYTDCKVTIKTKKNTKNYIEGGKFKKVSLVPSDDLGSYTSYYDGNAKTNYEKYTSYYGIYTKSEIENILFATVKADNEDLQDGDSYVFYKASGAISSDIDLYFEGEGYLSVTSKNKEGIETKGNLTFSGGTGDYEINAMDDCLNTTTSKKAGTNVRNSIVIDVHSMLAIVNDEGDEGDAIDSNGTLTINGGTIYAFAHSNSGDAGLDSEDGTFINGGTIIATGNMADEISSESKQKYIFVKLGKTIEKGTLIVIKDQDNEIITAFKTDKNLSTLFYSSEDLDYKSYKIYTGGTIDGEETNGLYTSITSYEDGTEIIYSEVQSSSKRQGDARNSFVSKLLIGELIASILLVVYLVVDKNLAKRNG